MTAKTERVRLAQALWDAKVALVRHLGGRAASSWAMAKIIASHSASAEPIWESYLQSRSDMVVANFALVKALAQKFTRLPGVDWDDLEQEGRIGLMRAVDGFDPRQGWDFATYAGRCILHAIKRGLDNSYRLCVPAYISSFHQRLEDAEARLVQETQQPAKLDDLVKSINRNPALIRSILRMTNRPRSLDYLMQDDNLQTNIEPESRERGVDWSLMNQESLDALRDALARLNPRRRLILAMFYGFDGQSPHTLRQLGDALGICRELARQLRREAEATVLVWMARARKTSAIR